jgi:hypothetical protein
MTCYAVGPVAPLARGHEVVGASRDCGQLSRRQRTELRRRLAMDIIRKTTPQHSDANRGTDVPRQRQRPGG